MPTVVSCKFRNNYRTYYFAPGQVPDLHINDQVIVETARGRELAQVVNPCLEVDEKEIVGELKPIIRRATPEELLEAQSLQDKEADAIIRCKEEAAKANLPMKIVGAEYNFDGSNLTFYFTSEQRIDFRELVRDLAHIFHTRIELRQVGVRDEAKAIGGIGKCGRPLCCATWLPEFYPVSIRMAKLQDLPLSPMEISGCCGRLLCCLSYENDQYAEVKSHFPKVGKTIELSCGPVKVMHVDALHEMATVMLEDGTIRQLTAEQIAGNAPLECEPDEEFEEQQDTLNGVLATLGEKARQSLETFGEPSSQKMAAPGSESRGENKQHQNRPVSQANHARQPGMSQPRQNQQQAGTNHAQGRQQPQGSQSVTQSPAEAAGTTTNVTEPAAKKHHRRGGRHHPRRERPAQAEPDGRRDVPPPSAA